jgi:hypothetical protein
MSSEAGLFVQCLINPQSKALQHFFFAERVATKVPGTVLVFREAFVFEDAIGSHACSLEALACVCPMTFLSDGHFLTS